MRRFTSISCRLSFSSLVLLAALISGWPVGSSFARRTGEESSKVRRNAPQDSRELNSDTLKDRKRPAGLAPLGQSFRPNLPPPGKRKGLIYTQQGFVDPR